MLQFEEITIERNQEIGAIVYSGSDQVVITRVATNAWQFSL